MSLWLLNITEEAFFPLFFSLIKPSSGSAFGGLASHIYFPLFLHTLDN